MIDTSTLYILGQPEQSILQYNSISLQSSDNNYRLLCVGQGGHILLDKSGKGKEVQNASLYLIPAGNICTIKSLKQDIEILSIDFRAHTNLCNGLCPSSQSPTRLSSMLGNQRKKCEKISVGLKMRPRRQLPLTTTLAMSPSIELWVQSFSYLLQHSNIPAKYYDNKIDELFLLLRLSYKQEEVNKFLHFYHCRIEGFREYIMNTLNPKTEVSSLYAEGEKIGLNEVAFKRTFIEEFGQSPREWLSEQRARMIYKELVLTNKPFKEMSDDFGFCSVSHFGAFCKQTLGDTPLHIRKNIQSA